MKYSVLFLLMLFVVGSVQADNLFSDSNPFPQTSLQNMNNIYEAHPEVIKEEQKKAKRSWFRKGKNLQQSESQNHVIPQAKIINEGVDNDSFYVVK